MAEDHTTTSHRLVVSKCALAEGRQRERSAQAIPGRSRFDSLLLVNHRPFSIGESGVRRWLRPQGSL